MDFSHLFTGDVRLATVDDLPRLGMVATAGFYYTQNFHFRKPYHKQYPQDTAAGYMHNLAKKIQHEDNIVAVVEAPYLAHENDSTDATILENNGWLVPEEGTKVVVGLAAWTVKGAAKGQFGNQAGTMPELPPDLRRDNNPDRNNKVLKAIGSFQERFTNDVTLDMMAVHPAYWQRGKGKQLVKVGLEIAAMDGSGSALFATPMGQYLYSSCGYEHFHDIHVDGDEDMPEGCSFTAMRHQLKPDV